MNIQKYYLRGRHPIGFWGKRALKEMNNSQHAELPEWVFGQVKIDSNANALDVGCGSGANVSRLLKLCPDGHVTALDFSTLALEYTTDYNYPAYVDGKLTITGGNAVQMPLARDIFNVATAFETIYYWPSLESGVEEMFRVLKADGLAIIANERDGMRFEEDDNLVRAVGGMRVYTSEEIEQALADAGFTDITTMNDEQRHFLCVTARKP